MQMRAPDGQGICCGDVVKIYIGGRGAISGVAEGQGYFGELGGLTLDSVSSVEGREALTFVFCKGEGINGS